MTTYSQPVVDARLEGADDVLVIEQRRSKYASDKLWISLQRIGRGALGQHLHHHRLLHARRVHRARQEHVAHGAGADLAEQVIGADEARILGQARFVEVEFDVEFGLVRTAWVALQKP